MALPPVRPPLYLARSSLAGLYFGRSRACCSCTSGRSGALLAGVRALSAGDRRGRGPPPAGVGLLRPEFRLLRPGCRTHPGRRGDPVWPPSTAGAVVGANGWPGLEKCSRFLSRYCEPPSMTPKINNPKGMLVSGPRKPLHNPWQFHYTHSNM